MFSLMIKSRHTRRAKAMQCLTGLMALAGTYAQAGEPKDTDVFGRWRLTAALDSSDISSLDDREAQQLIGRVIMIDKDHVKFGKRDCGPPELEAQWVVPALYLREKAHASSELLRLPNPVTVVKLGCTIAFIKTPQNIVVHWKGWFFDAKRLR